MITQLLQRWANASSAAVALVLKVVHVGLGWLSVLHYATANGACGSHRNQTNNYCTPPAWPTGPSSFLQIADLQKQLAAITGGGGADLGSSSGVAAHLGGSNQGPDTQMWSTAAAVCNGKAGLGHGSSAVEAWVFGAALAATLLVYMGLEDLIFRGHMMT